MSYQKCLEFFLHQKVCTTTTVALHVTLIFLLTLPLSAESEAGESKANFSVIIESTFYTVSLALVAIMCRLCPIMF